MGPGAVEWMQVITNGAILVAIVGATWKLRGWLGDLSNAIDRNRRCQILHVKATRRLASAFKRHLQEEIKLPEEEYVD